MPFVRTLPESVRIVAHFDNVVKGIKHISARKKVDFVGKIYFSVKILRLLRYQPPFKILSDELSAVSRLSASRAFAFRVVGVPAFSEGSEYYVGFTADINPRSNTHAFVFPDNIFGIILYRFTRALPCGRYNYIIFRFNFHRKSFFRDGNKRNYRRKARIGVYFVFFLRINLQSISLKSFSDTAVFLRMLLT